MNYLLAIVLSFSMQNVAGQSFVHPGILHTAADFTRIQAKVAAQEQPWLEAWNVLITNSHAQLTYYPNTLQIIYRGGNYPQNYPAAMNDAAAAYQCALRWKISGDTAYANKAIQILNAWALVCIGVSGDSNSALAVGLQGFAFANAAEIMRTYSGWSASDFAKFQLFMRYVFYVPASNFLFSRFGTCATHYWANWGLCNASTVIAIGILCDDIHIFNEGMYYIKSGPYNEAIKNVVYHLFSATLGQWQESNRDQSHTLLGVGLASAICEVAWSQGEDLYAYDSSRLLAGFEYVAKFNLGDCVPDTAYNNCDNVNQIVIDTLGRGGIRPEWDAIYNHFVNRKGIKVPYAQHFADSIRPDGGGGNYGTTSGGFDLLGFETLTKSLDTLVTTCLPTAITPSVQVNGTRTQTANININKGENIKFLPATSSKGTWLWSNGLTTQDMTLKSLDSNIIYRVVFTNSCGTESSQYFSVGVSGDCFPMLVTPYLFVNFGTGQNAKSIVVNKGDNVSASLGVSGGSGGSYLWSNGATTNGVSLLNIQTDTTFTATYYFPCGTTATDTFVITVHTLSQELAQVQAEAIQLRDTTKTSATDVPGEYPVAAKPLLNDSILYVQNNYDSLTATDSLINVYITVLANAINTYEQSVYFSVNTLANGLYYIKIPQTDSAWTLNGSGIPEFDKDPSIDSINQLFYITRASNGRYKITAYNGAPSGYKNYFNDNAQFSSSAFNSASSTMNFYYNGSTYAIQRAQSAGNGYWYTSENLILTQSGTTYSDTPVAYPFKLIKVSPPVPLPVKIASFTIDLLSNQTAELLWATEQETNNSYFSIEKSSDGISFSEIGKVSSKSGTANDYYFIDSNPIHGNNYYRLKQVNDDGTFSYSATEMVTVKDAVQKPFYVYQPQGATRSFFIHINDSNLNNVQVTLLDIMGRSIVNKNFPVPSSMIIEVNTGNIAAGVYVVQINNVSQKIFIR